MVCELKKVTENISLFEMKSDALEIVVTNFGGTILKILMPDNKGQKGDVVLGYDEIKEYQTRDAYLGALVGRVANRIRKGSFELNGKTYQLPINDGPNSLHGGIKGFSQKVFDAEIQDDSLVLSYLSCDGEEGYPGNLQLTATYTLKKDTLTIDYEATTDEDTLINLTNHSYFNLSGGQEDVQNHVLQLRSNRFACIDKDGLPTGEFRQTKDTPFDFNQPKRIGDALACRDEQLTLGLGIDHPFLFDAKENQIVLSHPATGRRLTISTTLPGTQVYTGNQLDGRIGKYGISYGKHFGVCLETQNLPDAIHLEKEPSTILKKGETYKERTTYTFEVTAG
ncbi:MAG: aldose epimerase family protein [Christensenellales bacterium]|jgi:aldose 1-epimerase